MTEPPVAKTLRIVVADDEPLARQRLEDLLAKESDVEIVATPSNGDDTVEAIRELKPDLVFLDVQMPGKTGVEVVRSIGPDVMPTTVFVTAFNHHALSAFELAAIDYLVKPFDDERFQQAFRRARHAIELEEVSALRSKLLAVLQGDDGAPASPSPSPASQYLERISVESKGKVNFVRVAEIDYIVSSGPYAELHVGDKTHLIRESMQNLESQLDPAEFIRIHRSIIVRTALVDTLHKAAGGDYEVQLKGGARLKVSRTRREELEKRLGSKGPNT